MKSGLFHYTSCGLRNIYLRNGFHVKETPYGRVVSIQDVEGLHRAIGLHLVRNKTHLTGAEVRFLRKELDMSQATLAKCLQVGETTVRNWESGRVKATGPGDRMIRALYQEYATGNSEIRELVDRLAELNRVLHAKTVEFEETKQGWRAAA
ncbi:MAG: helix-turn-helix domain-containing protein [Gammaproteobacteria bacterium]|nr:helix-turn-helix domain-containing protein [Gammaproteobacteria bacterium]